jgi:hypothetical protein
VYGGRVVPELGAAKTGGGEGWKLGLCYIPKFIIHENKLTNTNCHLHGLKYLHRSYWERVRKKMIFWNLQIPSLKAKAYRETPSKVKTKGSTYFLQMIRFMMPFRKWAKGGNIGHKRMWGECRRVDMMQILCTYTCKLKNETCWNYSRTRGKGFKGEQGRGWTQVWYIVRTFVNFTIYPQYNKKKRKFPTSSTHQKKKKKIGLKISSRY